MSALAPLPAIDLLADAIEKTRQYLAREKSVATRVKIFWSAVAAARHFAATDVVHHEFSRLAVESGLFVELAHGPPYAAGPTIDHLIRWGMLEQDPFGRIR
jgi:hypothetical protein